MVQAQQNSSQKKVILAQAGLLSACLFALLVLTKLASPVLALALILAAASFFVARQSLWRLLVLVLPLLTLGQIFYLELRPGLVYELSLAEALLFFVTAAFLIERLATGQFGRLRLDWILVLLAGLWLLAAASYAPGMVVNYYLYILKVLAMSWLAYFLAKNLLDRPERLRAFYHSVAATVVIVAGELVYKFFQLGITGKFFSDRKSVVLPLAPLATSAAILAVLSLLLVSYYFWRHEQTGKSFGWLAVIAVAFVAVFLSMGKAAILSLGLGLAFLFFNLRERRPVVLLAGLAAVVVGILAFSPVAVGLAERVINTFNDANTQYRLLEYETASKVLAAHWQTGVGAGQQMAHFERLLNYDKSDLLNNFLLQAWVDLGLAGLVLTLGLALSLFLKARGAYRATPHARWLGLGLFAMLLAAFLNGLVEVTFLALPYAIVFWLALGAVTNIPVYEKSFRHHH